MIKKFCDACGKDISEVRSKTFSYACHLGMPHLGGYSDSEGNSISGRDDCHDLCNNCYNRVMITAVNKFKELKKDNGVA